MAVLRRIDTRYRENMRQGVDSVARDARGRLLASFAVLEDWFRGKPFYGCPFMSDACEYIERDSISIRDPRPFPCRLFERAIRSAGKVAAVMLCDLRPVATGIHAAPASPAAA
jgi:hypothetical protein